MYFWKSSPFLSEGFCIYCFVFFFYFFFLDLKTEILPKTLPFFLFNSEKYDALTKEMVILKHLNRYHVLTSQNKNDNDGQEPFTDDQILVTIMADLQLIQDNESESILKQSLDMVSKLLLPSIVKCFNLYLFIRAVSQWFSQRTSVLEVAGSIPAPFIIELLCILPSFKPKILFVLIVNP